MSNKTPEACGFCKGSGLLFDGELNDHVECGYCAPVQPPAPDPDETRHERGCAAGISAARCQCPVPPATTGGTDEAEGLAEELIRRNWQFPEGANVRTHEDWAEFVEQAGFVLATSWLRERDLARDAQARAEGWDAAVREVREACLTPQEFAIADRAKRLNPYRADREATR